MLQRNEFSIEKAMQVVLCHKQTHDPAQPIKPPVGVDNIKITEDVLKQCTLKMAHIVQQDDTYLPIFKRLKTEPEELRKANDLKKYAYKLANKEIEL